MALAKQMMGGGLSAGQAKAINGAIAPAVSAAGTTQGTATTIGAGINLITTVAANSGVILPSCEKADYVEIYNAGANTLTVYPDSGSQINGVAANTGISLAINTFCGFRRMTSTRWAAQLSA